MKKFGLFFAILMVMMAVGCSNSSNGHDDGDAISIGSGTGNAGNGNSNNNSNSGSGNRVTGVNYNSSTLTSLAGKTFVCETYDVDITYPEQSYLNTGLSSAAGMLKHQQWRYTNYEYIVGVSDTEAVIYRYGITGYTATSLTYSFNWAGSQIIFDEGPNRWNVVVQNDKLNLYGNTVGNNSSSNIIHTGTKTYYEWNAAPTSGTAAMIVEEFYD